MTGKGYSPTAQWSRFGNDKVHASSLKELKEKLSERYGKSWKHRRPMYRDKADGSTVRAGYIVGFRADDTGRFPVAKWIQQDWVSFTECKPIEWCM